MSEVQAVVGTVSTALLWASSASACPSCPTARLARAQIYDAHFGTNLFATLAPLAVLLAIAVLLRRLGRPRGRIP